MNDDVKNLRQHITLWQIAVIDGYTYMSQRNRITLASPPVVAPQHRQPAAAENNKKYNKQSYHIVQHRVFSLFILVIERPSPFVYGRHRFLLVLPVSMAPPLHIIAQFMNCAMIDWACAVEDARRVWKPSCQTCPFKMASDSGVAEAIRRAKEASVIVCCHLQQRAIYYCCFFYVQLANKMTAGSGGTVPIEDASRKRAPEPDDTVTPAAKKLMEIRKYLCYK